MPLSKGPPASRSALLCLAFFLCVGCGQSSGPPSDQETAAPARSAEGSTPSDPVELALNDLVEHLVDGFDGHTGRTAPGSRRIVCVTRHRMLDIEILRQKLWVLCVSM